MLDVFLYSHELCVFSFSSKTHIIIIYTQPRRIMSPKTQGSTLTLPPRQITGTITIHQLLLTRDGSAFYLLFLKHLFFSSAGRTNNTPAAWDTGNIQQSLVSNVGRVNPSFPGSLPKLG